jgi:hypothetical protein
MSGGAPIVPNATYRFMSFVREGMSGVVSTVDTLGKGAPIPAVASVDITVPVTGADFQDASQPKPDTVATTHVTVQGPGDVIGLNSHQVIRTFPPAGVTNAETTMFPLVEFDRPDLPWMFTPAKETAAQRLRPWLCLVVVRAQPGVTLGPLPDKPLPVLTIDTPANAASELPDPADAWLWAHAQAIGAAGGAISDVLAHPSSLTLSRLICPRNLLPDAAYLACVVPTFAVGRKAGLGLPVTAADESDLAPAWKPVDTSVTLPVYFHFTFSTAPAGDFESLAELLQPRAVPPTLGHRAMDVTRPGSGLPEIDPVAPQTPGAVFDLQGALCAPEFTAPPWPDSARKPFAEKLTADLNAPFDHAHGNATMGELTVGPPIYGQWHAAAPKIDDAAPVWMRDLNLDPGNRVTAALGAAVVEADAEDLMASAWSQVGAIDAANRALRLAQLGREVLQRYYDRHVTHLVTSDSLHATSPVHRRIIDGTGSTIASVIAASALPRPAATTVMRRVVRLQGRGGATLVPRLAQGSLLASPAVVVPDGTVALSDPVTVLGAPLAGQVAAKLGIAQSGEAGLAQHVSAQNAILSRMPSLATQVMAVAKAPPAAAQAASGTVSLAGQAVLFAQHDAIAKQSTVMQAVLAQRVTVTGLQIAAAEAPLNVPIAHPASLVAPGLLPAAHAAESADAVMVRSAAVLFANRVVTAADAPPRALAPALEQARVQSALLQGLLPAVTVVARLSHRLNIDLTLRPGFGAAALDPLAGIMAAPVFTRPMYQALRDYDQDALVPGLEELLPNTITLVATNPRFVEAFLVGLNHEMARKLLWREYPTDQRGTYFKRFWGATDDIGAIPAFGRGLRLGSNVAGGGVPHLVLLVRGELLRRYPSAIVYAVPATGGTVKPVFDDTRIKLPIFRGSLKPDFTFIGFDLTEAEALAAKPSALGQPEEWWFVIAEHPTEPRFGLHNAQFGAPLKLGSWNDLTWAHVARTENDLRALAHAPSAAAFAPLLGARIDNVAYGADAGAQAHVCFRNPVRVAMRARDALVPPPSPPPVPEVLHG